MQNHETLGAVHTHTHTHTHTTYLYIYASWKNIGYRKLCKERIK